VLKLYIAHLREGHSRLEQRIHPNDIELAESEEFREPIDIVFDIDKVGNDFFVDVKLSSRIHLECDRCLESYTSRLNEKFKVIFSQSDNLQDADQEDIFSIDDGTSEVDITHSVRQMLILALPFKRLCKQKCKGLCPSCGINLNTSTCSCRPEHVDPRWEVLKKLKETM
jgi:uncharacterized protein